jgi:lipopolysaccharide/colanic/teichoic acid biosynthesis glycosyltransferase
MEMISNSVSAQTVKVAINSSQADSEYKKDNQKRLNNRSSRLPILQPAYLFSEYIWGSLVLSLSILSRLAGSIKVAIPLEGIDGRFVKRTIDIVGAGFGLLLTLPFFIILPILIKLDSPGPVFYKQLRVGHNRRRRQRRNSGVSDLGRSSRDRRRQNFHGRLFEVIKFRTMIADAEKKCGAVWATKNDPRITLLGNIMRKTRMDEIPQFLNILKGDMSLVGPRPERPVFVEELSEKVEDYKKRLDVKPGLTGLAQVENGYDSSIASVVKKVQYDLQYIKDWSVWQDVKIMLKTVVVVVTGKGAF